MWGALFLSSASPTKTAHSQSLMCECKQPTEAYMLTVHSRALSDALSLVHPEVGQRSEAASVRAAETSAASTDEARASNRGSALELEGDLAVVELAALEVLNDVLSVLA